MKNRSAILLLHVANTLGGIAQGITMLAVPWYFVTMENKETLFGWVLTSVTFISMFWGIYAGVIIDSSNRRDLFSKINLSGFAFLVLFSVFSGLMPEYNLAWAGFAFATTVFIYNIHFPNLYAFAQEITERKYYSSVISQLEIQGQLTFTLAGGFAAILLSGIQGNFELLGVKIDLPFYFNAFTITEILYLNALAYLATYLIFYFIKFEALIHRDVEPENVWTRLQTGFRYLWKRKTIFYFGNISLLLFMCILVEGLYVLPSFVKNYLKAGGDVYAQSDMVFSLGALMAGLLTTKVFNEKNPVLGIIFLMIVGSILFTTFSLHKNVVLFYITNFFIGVCNASIRIQRVTYIFKHIENDVIGRANSVWFMLNVLLRLFTIAFISLPYFHVGENIKYAMVLFGGICLFAGILLLSQYKKLQKQPEL